MNLAFFTFFLADVCNQAQVLLKRSCRLGKLVITHIKGISLLYTGKIIFVSVAFLMALRNCTVLYCKSVRSGTVYLTF